jgi:hypothetical protein
MPDAVVSDVVSIVMPLVVGYLTVPITDAVKHGVAFIDRQPAAVKQGLTASIAGALTIVARLLETQLPEDLALWDASTADVLVSSVFAMAVKHSRRIKDVAIDATIARETAEMRSMPKVDA